MAIWICTSWSLGGNFGILFILILVFNFFLKDNRESLTAYISKVHQGVRGRVFDSEGNSIDGLITIQDIEHPVTTSKIDNWYYRPLPPGSFVVMCSSPRYPNVVQQQEIVVEEDSYVIVDFEF